MFFQSRLIQDHYFLGGSAIPMNSENGNRRKFKRVFFDAEDKIIAKFSIPGGQKKPIAARVLNLSEGGIHVTLDAADIDNVNSGARLILLQIKGPVPFDYLVSIDTEVKWIVNHPILEFAGLGCEFRNISASSRIQVSNFVEEWFEKQTPGD